MHPAIEDQDYLIAAKLPFRVHVPERGDIVIIRNPINPSEDLIKRIIALPGDRLRIGDCNVYINQRVLKEPYLGHKQTWHNCEPVWPQNGSPTQLGSNDYFVMGDNRDNSTDSRNFGVVKGNQIEAQAWLRVFPLNHIGRI
jgi:signal peptidase I